MQAILGQDDLSFSWRHYSILTSFLILWVSEITGLKAIHVCVPYYSPNDCINIVQRPTLEDCLA